MIPSWLNMTIAAGAVLVAVSATSMSSAQAESSQTASESKFHLPMQTAGTEAIVQTLISVFDQFDIVALGESHGQKSDSDLRIALVRHPDFAKKVHFIEVESASTTQQATLDRYIRGENISRAQLQNVWKTTKPCWNNANCNWDDPIYAEFFAAIRDVNAKLPPEKKIRVLGGDPGPGDDRSRETAAFDVLKEQVLQKHAKALLIYGGAHFYREYPIPNKGPDTGLVRMIERDFPGKTFAVLPLGGPRITLLPSVVLPVEDFGKFDNALKSPIRPVLISVQNMPFRDFRAEEFFSRDQIICAPPDGCKFSSFRGSPLTIGQMADAVIYFGPVQSH